MANVMSEHGQGSVTVSVNIEEVRADAKLAQRVAESEAGAEEEEVMAAIAATTRLFATVPRICDDVIRLTAERDHERALREEAERQRDHERVLAEQVQRKLDAVVEDWKAAQEELRIRGQQLAAVHAQRKLDTAAEDWMAGQEKLRIRDREPAVAAPVPRQRGMPTFEITFRVYLPVGEDALTAESIRAAIDVSDGAEDRLADALWAGPGASVEDGCVVLDRVVSLAGAGAGATCSDVSGSGEARR